MEPFFRAVMHQIRTAAAHRIEQLIRVRIVDGTVDHRSPVAGTYGDRAVAAVLHEIGRAVDGIHDEGLSAGDFGRMGVGGFFAQHIPIRQSLGKRRAQELFCADVVIGHEILRTGFGVGRVFRPIGGQHDLACRAQNRWNE